MPIEALPQGPSGVSPFDPRGSPWGHGTWEKIDFSLVKRVVPPVDVTGKSW